MEIMYREESYRIIQSCYEVFKHLGPGLMEIVYKDALEIEFRKQYIPFEREKKYEIIYKGVKLQRHYLADFVVFEKIILEVKAIQKEINNIEITQTLNYLSLSKNRLGLIVNFSDSVRYKRIVK